MEDSYKPRTRESEAGESPKAQSQPGLHGKFQGNMRPHLKKKKKKDLIGFKCHTSKLLSHHVALGSEIQTVLSNTL